MNKTTQTLIAAAAITGLFTGATVRLHAASENNSGKQGISQTAIGSLLTDDDKGKHDCKGKNSCKGKGGCKSGDNGCKGKNSCKGKGGCSTKGSCSGKDGCSSK